MITRAKVLFNITRSTCRDFHWGLGLGLGLLQSSIVVKDYAYYLSRTFLCRNQNLMQCQTATLRNHIQYDSSDECDYEEHYAGSDYTSFQSGKRYGRKIVLKKLQDLFKCTTKEAEVMVQVCPGLSRVTSENITENVKFLSERGLQSETLKDNPWLLTFKISALSLRLNFVQKVGIDDINVAVPLLQIPFNQLRDLSSGAKKEAPLILEGSRIHHISKKLDCDPAEVCKVVADHLFLQTMPLGRLDLILQLLLKYGVSPKHILKDVWVFRYSPTLIEDRLKQAYDAGVETIKPWVVRCPKAVFSNTLRIRVESRTALGSHSSAMEYLSQRLECSLDSITNLCEKYPPLLKVHVVKLKEVLDFLYDEGFSPQQVWQVPRVLCHSLETLEERLNQIRDLGHNPTSLIVLCKSKRQYSEYISKLKSRQKQAFL